MTATHRRAGRSRLSSLALALLLLFGGVVFVGPLVVGLAHLTHFPFGIALFNSLVIAISFTALSTVSAAFAGYAFARSRVRWKNILFLFVLNFLIFITGGLVNSGQNNSGPALRIEPLQERAVELVELRKTVLHALLKLLCLQTFRLDLKVGGWFTFPSRCREKRSR